MPIVGNPVSFQKKFQFQVWIENYLYMGFQKMSALEAEVADIKHFEGGSLIANKSAGRIEFKDVTLERGATILDYDALNWFIQVTNPERGKGRTEREYKRSLSVVQQDRDGTVQRVWNLFGAWPKTFVAGEWDNTVDENVIERLTLCYDYFVRGV